MDKLLVGLGIVIAAALGTAVGMVIAYAAFLMSWGHHF